MGIQCRRWEIPWRMIGTLVGLHFVDSDQARAHAVDFLRIAPIGLVNDNTVAVDQIGHIRQEAVSAMRGPGEIVDKNWNFLDLLRCAQHASVRQLLFQ